MAYDIAPPRVRSYLDAEIQFFMDRIGPGDRVLELGCGYGRILRKLLSKTKRLAGIDTAVESLRMALEYVGPDIEGRLFAMDAIRLGFGTGSFDVTVCMQNGISAFKVDPSELMREALRVTRRGGRVVFSSYAERFWPNRLEWFRLQAAHGLIGEIDEEATGTGVIVCKDGFRATTVGPEDFKALAVTPGVTAEITEMAEGSVICEMTVH
jgi:2-polyprenyl-6-hydroxyphenyl methylase/3-demethylubiquinone-9 3-methyltransferase